MKNIVTMLVAIILLLGVLPTVISDDTTPPEIKNVVALPSSIIQGETVTIKCDVTDNEEVNVVKVVIEYPDNSTVNMTMKKSTNKANEYYYTNMYKVVGTYKYHIWANDTSGNSNVSSNHTFYVGKDIYPPVTYCNLYGKKGKNNWYVSNVSVELIATDKGMGVKDTYYMLEGKPWLQYKNMFKVTNEGIYDLYYYSVDNAGNKEDIKYKTFKIDKTKPTTTYELNGYKGNDGWYITNVTVHLFASDAVSGINKTFYRIGNGSWQTYSNEFAISKDGVYTVYYYSVDRAGNTEDIKHFTLKIDKAKPIATIVKPRRGYLYLWDREIMPTLFGNTLIIGRITIFVDASNHESGIQKVQFYIDNILQIEDSEPPYAWEWNYLAIGTHLIKVVAYDNAGNYGMDEMVVKVFNI